LSPCPFLIVVDRAVLLMEPLDKRITLWMVERRIEQFRTDQQHQTRHSPDDIGMGSSAIETALVIHLGVLGHPDTLEDFQAKIQDFVGGFALVLLPVRVAGDHVNGIEAIYQRPTCQVVWHIVQLGQLMWTLRVDVWVHRSWLRVRLTRLGEARFSQDLLNCAKARDRLQTLFQHSTANRSRANVRQSIGLAGFRFQFGANLPYLPLGLFGDTGRLMVRSPGLTFQSVPTGLVETSPPLVCPRWAATQFQRRFLGRVTASQKMD